MKTLNRIKIIRQEKGLSIEDVANLSKLSISAISDIENGVHIPNQVSMLRISNGLKLKMHKIFILDYKDAELS